MTRIIGFFLILVICAIQSPSFAAEKPAPRVIYGFYSSQNHTLAKYSFIHQFLEMPLNHLGYKVKHFDVEQPLPEIDDSVKAIVVWLVPGTSVANPGPYLDWLLKAVDSGKKLIIIENLGIPTEYRDTPEGHAHLNGLLNKIGVNDLNTWNELTYRSHLVYKDTTMVEYERAYSSNLSPYMDVLAIPGVGKSYLKVRSESETGNVTDLVITSPRGGYIAGGYAMFEGYQQPVPEEQRLSIVNMQAKKAKPQKPADEENPSEQELQALTEMEDKKHDDANIFPIQQWYINPFLFLSTVLQDSEMPKPDVTTVNGRRIFYSHIDADGWNNIATVAGYRERKAITAEVVREQVLEAYPDMPFNVSIITAEMDLNCYGLHQSADEARKIFKLPNVEPSSHSHSHPLAWGYFADNDPDKERPLLDLYPDRPGSGTSLFAMLREEIGRGTEGWKSPPSENPEYYQKQVEKNKDNNEKFGMSKYETPRSYACEPFSIEQEIVGSINEINEKYVPKGKKARLIQWSGDTTPFDEALRLCRENNILNINGGDSRFDNEYPSYASVSPIGIQLGDELQIYSSNSNENTYTNLWTDRFYGFVYLQSTVWNTEHPIRVQPFNIYFHMYSGEKQASLNALRANLNYARRQPVIRMYASEFAEIANSFYKVNLIPLGDGGWRVTDRGMLNTLRLDDASLKTVDFSRSKGVMGENHFQGSLYISLDPQESSPILYFKPFYPQAAYPVHNSPYLIESNLFIKGLHIVKKSLMFDARGWGNGKLKIKYPSPVSVSLVMLRDGKTIEEGTFTSDKNGVMDIKLNESVVEPVKVILKEVTEQ